MMGMDENDDDLPELPPLEISRVVPDEEIPATGDCQSATDSGMKCVARGSSVRLGSRCYKFCATHYIAALAHLIEAATHSELTVFQEDPLQSPRWRAKRCTLKAHVDDIESEDCMLDFRYGNIIRREDQTGRKLFVLLLQRLAVKQSADSHRIAEILVRYMQKRHPEKREITLTQRTVFSNVPFDSFNALAPFIVVSTRAGRELKVPATVVITNQRARRLEGEHTAITDLKIAFTVGIPPI